MTNNVNPSEVIFFHRCKKCNTLFQFEKEDCAISYDRFSPIFYIKCPKCGTETDSTSQWEFVSKYHTEY